MLIFQVEIEIPERKRHLGNGEVRPGDPRTGRRKHSSPKRLGREYQTHKRVLQFFDHAHGKTGPGRAEDARAVDEIAQQRVCKSPKQSRGTNES